MTVALPETPEVAKARGAFYTPPEITRYLSTWAIRSSSDWVLEPSAGNGAFLTAIGRRLADLSPGAPEGGVLGVEREPQEAEKARKLAPDAEIRDIDFFDLDPESTRRFAAVIGNPPYVRYQGFRGADRTKALARTHAQGVELTGLASSWAHFVVHASAFLEDNGRLALVLPAELLHTDYADPVRALLLRRFRSVTVVAFDRAAFPTAQVDAVLLLASDDEPPGFRVVRVTNVADLGSVDFSRTPTAPEAPARWSGSVDHEAGDTYLKALGDGSGVPLGQWAHVDIGFVSGANDFFVLTRDEAAELNLPTAVLTTAVRRPSDAPGLVLRHEETRVLIDLAGKGELDHATSSYVAIGEERDLHQRYKSRSRSPWYAVPLPKRMPDAFLPYMHHLGPRLIVNSQTARNSNLLHGVALKADAPPVAAIAVAMASSMTLLSAEIEGRAYGGGVLKLETKEAERTLVPRIGDPEPLSGLLPEIDRLIRAGEVKGAALMVDQQLGLPHSSLWRAYEALKDRRLGRRRV